MAGRSPASRQSKCNLHSPVLPESILGSLSHNDRRKSLTFRVYCVNWNGCASQIEPFGLAIPETHYRTTRRIKSEADHKCYKG